MIQNELDAMKEIHDIRVGNFERTKYLSPDERSRLRSKTVMPIAEKYGLRVVPKSYYSLQVNIIADTDNGANNVNMR